MSVGRLVGCLVYVTPLYTTARLPIVVDITVHVELPHAVTTTAASAASDIGCSRMVACVSDMRARYNQAQAIPTACCVEGSRHLVAEETLNT